MFIAPLLTIEDPQRLAQSLLALCETEVWVKGREHLPVGAAVVIGNHRSFLDAAVVIAALARPVRFACHYYLTQVPVLRQVALGLGCIPLVQGSRQQIHFFRQAERYLRQQQAVGLFPEGAEQIARRSSSLDVGGFRSGFVHLALCSRVDPLPIVPVALRVRREWTGPEVPLSLLRHFDPTEPMFQGQGTHPMVFYRQVEVEVLRPFWISASERGLDPPQRNGLVDDLTDWAQAALQQAVAD